MGAIQTSESGTGRDGGRQSADPAAGTRATAERTSVAGLSDGEFAARVRAWLDEQLSGEFRELRGLGGPGREHEAFDERLEWDRALAAAGWTCLGWPVEYGGRAASVGQQIIFHEEYAKANAPARVSH
ncbi:acyl-CoA dehydrogenase family protein, partial [Nocardia sp. NPDC003345]